MLPNLSSAIDELTPEQELFVGAILEGDVPLVENLIKKGSSVNGQRGSLGSPLEWAISSNKPDMVKFLLSKGADPLARDSYDNLPIEALTNFREGDITPLIKALKREPTAEEQKTLMEIPAPVWRSVLGKEPAKKDAPEKPQETAFITINAKDPLPEMTPLLDRYFPGWKPGSEVKRDGKDLRVAVELTKTITKDLPKEHEGLLLDYLRKHDLPAYEFGFYKTTGPLSGGGCTGFVVFLGGTWMKAQETIVNF